MNEWKSFLEGKSAIWKNVNLVGLTAGVKQFICGTTWGYREF